MRFRLGPKSITLDDIMCLPFGGHLYKKAVSCAIAKMTTQMYTPHMGALKIFGTPWLRPRLFSQKNSWVFCSDWPWEYAYKIFKSVVLPVPEKNRGGPWLCQHSLCPQKILYAYTVVQTVMMCSRLPKIFDWSFGLGLRTSNLGKVVGVGVENGRPTVRNSVGEFLQ